MKKYCLLLALALLPFSALAAEPAPDVVNGTDGGVTTFAAEFSMDRMGGDYRSFDLFRPSWQMCEMSCRRDRFRCRAWTYVKPGVQGPRARCWLKNVVPQGQPSDCCVSGVMRRFPQH